MSANKDGSQLVYTVQHHKIRFEVCAESGRVVMVCKDEGSASHYASLLNDAHRAGYKQGYSDGRKHE